MRDNNFFWNPVGVAVACCRSLEGGDRAALMLTLWLLVV